MSHEIPGLYTYYKTWGNVILLCYRDKDGVKQSKKIDFYQPSLYVRPTEQVQVDAESIYGYPLSRVKFNGIKEAKEFADRYKNVENFTVEGNSNFANQFLVELYNGEMPAFDPNKIRAGVLDIEVHAPEFPEPSETKWPINGITVYDNFTDKYYTFGDKAYIHNRQSKDVGDCEVAYVHCDSEHQLLTRFIEHMISFQYDFTSGWNSETFDMPYIVGRCNKIVGSALTNRLSPFGKINTRTFTGNFGKEQISVDILGLPHLDYLALYKKHILAPRDSYKLGNIGEVELGMTKMSYEEEGKLTTLYEENPQKFYEYNIKDVKIVKCLNDKLGLFNLTYVLSYYTFSNFEDTLGTTKVWEFLVARHLYNVGQVPLFSKSGDYREFEGAFVKDPVVGFHRWGVSVDLNSLYPHIEMQVNIGPETYVPREQLPYELACMKSKYTVEDLIEGRIDLSPLVKYDYSMAANFEFYRKDRQSFFSVIKEDLYARRKKFKKQMLAAQQRAQAVKVKLQSATNSVEIDALNAELNAAEAEAMLCDNLQQGMKILLNAGYGALGNEHFLYFKVENAEAITLTGQLVNQWTCRRLNKQFNKWFKTTDYTYWLYGDTDSGYFTVAPFVDNVLRHVTDKTVIVDSIDKLMKDIVSPFIDKQTDELAKYINSYANKMVWEREVIAESMILTAKKRYAMKVLDSEGVRFAEPKIKIMGLEAVKSSTPGWSRKYLKECYTIALDNDVKRLHDRVLQMRASFKKLSISDIAIPRGVTEVDKYVSATTIYQKGTPKNVKAAIIHNMLVDKYGLRNVAKIVSGDKIKYIDLVKPNPIGQEVVGFMSYLPQEFNLDKYVNRERVFESAFLEPLSIFLESIGWHYEAKLTLADFF